MNRSFILASVLVIFMATSQLIAQERPVSRNERQGSNHESGHGFRRRSLAIDINARVSDGENVVWDQSERRTTISGNPVNMRLVGSNLVVAVQFTPFIRRGQPNVLVAHGQIWIQTPQGGMNYYTSIQTIPMELNEPIYFFPLGTENPSIQITLTVTPNREPAVTEETTEANDN